MWVTREAGDGSFTEWVADPPAPSLPAGFQWVAPLGDSRIDANAEGTRGFSGGVADLGGFLDDAAWRAAGFTGPTREVRGIGDSSDVGTSRELLEFMNAGGYALGQHDAGGITTDQLFQNGAPVEGARLDFVYNDNAFAAAFLAAATVVTAGVASWAGAGTGAGAGAGAAADTAAGAYTTAAADSALVGSSGAAIAPASVNLVNAGGILSTGVAELGTSGLSAMRAAELAGYQSAPGAADAMVATSSSWSAPSLGSIASGGSVVDAIGSAAGGLVKAAGAAIAPVLPKLITDALGPKPDSATFQPIGQARGAQAFPLLLIAGAVVLAFVALRK